MTSFAMGQNPCPRCPPAPDAAEAASLAAASPLAPSLRAADSLRYRRLELCAACGGLREQIICAYCGCLVQFRSRLKHTCCPNPSGDKWKKLEGNNGNENLV